jgi:uncharacterized protein YqeY
MILDELKAKLPEYQKDRDEVRLGVLRYLLSKISYKEIELRPQNQELTDEVVFKVLRKQIKDRKEAIELYTKGNRPDLVAKEQTELDVLLEFAKMFPFELEPARPQYTPSK